MFKLDGTEESEGLKQICKERNYANSDIKEIDFKMENYDYWIKKFATEHIHADEEILEDN